MWSAAVPPTRSPPTTSTRRSPSGDRQQGGLPRRDVHQQRDRRAPRGRHRRWSPRRQSRARPRSVRCSPSTPGRGRRLPHLHLRVAAQRRPDRRRHPGHLLDHRGRRGDRRSACRWSRAARPGETGSPSRRPSRCARSPRRRPRELPRRWSPSRCGPSSPSRWRPRESPSPTGTLLIKDGKKTLKKLTLVEHARRACSLQAAQAQARQAQADGRLLRLRRRRPSEAKLGASRSAGRGARRVTGDRGQ